MKLKTTRVIDSYKVRKLCINRDYCTNCDTEQYTELLNSNKLKAVNDEDILEIADKIMCYSNIEFFLNQSNYTELEFLETICYELINECTFTLVELV